MPVDVVGCYLAVRYTPFRADGDKGKPVVAISQETVAGEASGSAYTSAFSVVRGAESFESVELSVNPGTAGA